ncbi:xanthine dehydrogenase 1-like protein [Tanacetum coccineum]
MGSFKNDDELEESKDAILYVNGVLKVLPDGLAHLTLLKYLRDVGLTGTKLGCGEGGCGACTVMESLASRHGSQCGFCTPGFIMSMYALLRSSKTPPSEEQIEESLAGNLCRCTGYRPILDAFRVFAKSNDLLYTSGSVPSSEPKDGEFICPSTGKPCSCGPNKETTSDKTKICHDSIKPVSYNEIDGSSYTNKEHIFPPQLLLRKSSYLSLNGSGGIKWHRPLLLKQILDLKSRYPDAKLVVGNTEVGIETRLKKIHYPVFVSVTHVPELNVLTVNDDGIEIGAGVRLSELQLFLKKMIEERPGYETSACKAITEQIKWFAGTQIRNVASVGGNICTASPISDLNPLWMSSRAKFNIVDIKGNVRTVLAENFFLGYRKVDLGSNEILLSVMLPWTRQFEYVKEFKQAHRRDDDIALVNGAVKTKDYITGKVWNKELLQNSLEILTQDVVISDNAPGGMVEFRKSLTLSFFFKFYMWACHRMDGQDFFDEALPVSHLSAIESYHRPSVMGSQDYEITKQGTSVGSPEVQMSARLQVTGEAEYTDDTPMAPNGLHAALVLSKKPHARLVSIDDSGARSTPGFAGIFFAKDIPGDNITGPVVEDEEVFASEIVTCVGQVIGVIVADTSGEARILRAQAPYLLHPSAPAHENAKLAVRKVSIEYEELPAIFSIEDVVKFKSFHPNSSRILSKGDVEHCLQSQQCHKIIEGGVHIGGQEHFYLEPQSTFASQKNQKYVAHVLGLPMSKVVCKVKRIGGGFGGKETRSPFFAAVVAVPAYMLNRSVKLTLDRDVDMMTSGQRYNFLRKYKVNKMPLYPIGSMFMRETDC